MQRTVYRVDGTLARTKEPPTPFRSKPQTKPSGRGELALILKRLRQKARRLRVWLTVLDNTERGLVEASLRMESTDFGRRLANMLAQIASKIRENLRSNYFSSAERYGYDLISGLASFFYGNSARTQSLIQDRWLLRYTGTRAIFDFCRPGT